MVSPGRIALKRVYESPSDSGGLRILVDRIWPRGLSKEAAGVDLWLRALAPSNELRKWFHAHRGRWKDFRRRYLTELRTPETQAEDALKQLYDAMDREDRVALLFASKNTHQNNATVLKGFLTGMKKSRKEARMPAAPKPQTKTKTKTKRRSPA